MNARRYTNVVDSLDQMNKTGQQQDSNRTATGACPGQV